MTDAQVETGVDDLISYLEGKGKISLKDVASAISVSEDTLQLWVDFLVEERIIGLEYKFTKPYIFLNKSIHEEKKSQTEQKKDLNSFKEEFFASAREKKITESEIPLLWKQHLSSAINREKDFFILETQKHDLKINPEELFSKYLQKKISQTISKGDSS